MRRSPFPIIRDITIILAVVLSLIHAPRAAAVEYDQRNADNKVRFMRLYTRTAVCMRQSSIALLRQGVRQYDYIQEFIRVTCGDPLVDWLMSQEKFTRDEARTLLDDMTLKALTSAMRGPDSIITN